MGLTNLNNTHLSAAEATAAKDAVTQLETTLSIITANLNAEERQKLGRINEQNKLFVNKINDFHLNQPELQAPQIDWEEFERDFSSRLLMENLTVRLENLLTKLKSAKILHDHDNYQAALVDYAYTNFMAGTGVESYEIKLKELKQFFARGPQNKPTP